MMQDRQPHKPRFLRHIIFRVILSFVAGLPVAPTVCAQDTPAGSPVTALTPQLTVEQLTQRLKALESDESLSAEVRQKIQDALNAAIRNLQEEKSYTDRLAQLNSEVAAAASQLEEVRAALDAPPAEPKTPPPDTDLSAAQQQLSVLLQQLNEAEAEKTALEQEDAQRTRRRTEVPAELLAAKADLEKLEAQNVDAGADANPLLADALKAAHQTRIAALRAKINLLEQELPAYDATAPLLSAKLSLASRRVSQLRREVALWQDLVHRKRLSEAEAFAAEAEQLLQSVLPEAAEEAQELRDFAQSLVKVRTKLAADIAEADAKITAIQQQMESLKEDFDNIVSRAEAAGFTNSVGYQLRELRNRLPDVRKLQREIETRQAVISEIHLQQLDYKNQKSAIKDIDDLAKRLAAKYAPDADPGYRDALQDEFRRLLQARQKYLDGVIADLRTCLDRMATLDQAQRALLQQVQEQEAYIAEHVLWVRSAAVLGPQILREFRDAVPLLSVELRRSLESLKDDILRLPQVWMLALAVFSVLIFARGRLRQRIAEAGRKARRSITTEMMPTIEAFVLSCVVSMTWPLVFVFLAWRLEGGAATSLNAALIVSLRFTAMTVFMLDLLRHLCRPDGVCVAHFEMPARAAEEIRQSVRWALFFSVPFVFVAVLMDATGTELLQSSFGRIAMMAAHLTLAFAVHRVLRTGSPVVEETGDTRNHWLRRTRYLWYAVGVGFPVVLSGFAAAGYLYTAQQLSLRLLQTGTLLTVVLLVAGMIRRWQLLTYRELAMKQARERRAALQKAAESDEEPEIPVEDVVSAVSLSESNVRIGKLLNLVFWVTVIVGSLLIWSDVLPAFGILSRVELWKSTIETEVVDGIASYEWVTLRDVFLAIVCLGMTFFAASNVPGLLEFVVLQRLPLDSGTRYAISAVTRYIITVVGVAAACYLLGFGWSSIQWLVAAMTVGLGFGLQEIFANFVSGLILLFERPIRIGDTVTVGDVTGTVARIRIRATTIIDWDRKELIVPNKEFVTGQLVNWTLSDSTLRVIINVGIAYGSDTRLATELLYRVAAENSDVLKDPAPRVVFTTFGDSTLDFQLRCFVSSPQKYREISHELNLAIDDLFREHGIEIAFPQRDLHFRSSDIRLAVDMAENSDRPS